MCVAVRRTFPPEAIVNEELHSYASNDAALQELAFALLVRALAEKERARGVPLLGHSRDRRTLEHIGEVYTDENVRVLMCFICASKHPYHHGFDKFGEKYNAGRIDFRTNADQALNKLCCSPSAFDHNLSYSAFKRNYGFACRSDVQFQTDDVWEWRRTAMHDSCKEDMLCNPEDVEATELCRHDREHVCTHCRIPICNECWAAVETECKIPKALANDNFQGYVHSYLVENHVTWLEATIAAPVYSGLITYYIEGPVSERHHLMEEILTKPRFHDQTREDW